MKRRDIITIAVILLLVFLLANVMKRGKNWDKLKTLRTSVRRNFSNFLADLESAGYKPVVIDSHRTYQEQAGHYKKDKRNAKPGSSTHELDTGIDVIIYTPTGKRLGKYTPRTEWIATGIPDLATKKYGMRWGGNFKGYPDNNHFDYLLAA